MRRIAQMGLAAAGLAAAAGLSGCTVAGGPSTDEDREIDEVTAVELSTSGDLTVASGDPALTVTAPEGALGSLTSTVSDGRLVLGTTPGPTVIRGAIRYRLQVDHLDEVSVEGSGDVYGSGVTGRDLVVRVAGSGDVNLEDVDADRVEIHIDGSGDVRVTGTVGELDVSIDGSGQVAAGQLAAARAVVDVGGSGDVRVDVTDTLDVHIGGSGDVTYTGEPTLTSRVDGSGDLRKG